MGGDKTKRNSFSMLAFSEKLFDNLLNSQLLHVRLHGVFLDDASWCDGESEVSWSKKAKN